MVASAVSGIGHAECGSPDELGCGSSGDSSGDCAGDWAGDRAEDWAEDWAEGGVSGSALEAG